MKKDRISSLLRRVLSLIFLTRDVLQIVESFRLLSRTRIVLSGEYWKIPSLGRGNKKRKNYVNATELSELRARKIERSITMQLTVFREESLVRRLAYT